MALGDEAARAVAAARQLRGPTANLANTRALVVEPMLSALGWDVTNLDHVARDWPLDGDASISYALRVNDANALFVKATPVDASVDDEALVEETLGHVSTAEIRWCLMTNGLRYRLFKADDAVAKANRLMFELELADVAANRSPEAADNLSLLSRESLVNGVLEARGEEFYIDPRIQQALLELCRNPSSAFITAMNEAIGDPLVPVRRLRASLGRSVDARRSAAPRAPLAEVPPLGRPRTSHAPAHAAAPDEGEASSEPHPAPAGGIATAPPPPPPAPVAHEVATVAPPSAAIISPEVAAEPEHGQQAPAARAEPAQSILAGGPQVVTLAAPELLGEAQEAEPLEAVEQAEPDAQHGEIQWNVAPPGRFGRQPEYPLVDHFAGKPVELVELFEQLDRYAHGLGEDTARRVRRQNVEYFRGGQLWFAVMLMRDAVRINLTLEPAAFDAWRLADSARGRIASSPGLLGETEITLSDASHLTHGCELIHAAYESA